MGLSFGDFKRSPGETLPEWAWASIYHLLNRMYWTMQSIVLYPFALYAYKIRRISYLKLPYRLRASWELVHGCPIRKGYIRDEEPKLEGPPPTIAELEKEWRRVRANFKYLVAEKPDKLDG